MKTQLLPWTLCILLLAACGSSDDEPAGTPSGAGAAGASAGSAGGGGKANAGTGGTSAGTGGTSAGTGGTSAGTGGTSAGTGGTSAGASGAGAAGAAAGAGGAGTGASGAGAGGAAAGAGGTGSGGAAAGAAGVGGGASASAPFTAKEGGVLQVDGALVKAGEKTLKADLTLTGTSDPSTAGLPRAADVRGKVFDFGPAGSKFDAPVLIALPLPGAVPAGKQWTVAWLDTANAKWVPMPTVIQGDRAVSMTTHFTQFALLEQPKVDTAGGCAAKPACGGALSGHYDLGAACYTGKPLMSGPLPFCQAGGGVSGTELHAAGAMDFEAAAAVYQAITIGTFLRIDVEPACTTNISAFLGPVTTCADLEATLGDKGLKRALLCSGDVAKSCTCFGATQVGEVVGAGTFATAATTLTLTQGAQSANKEYCVEGDRFDMTDQGSFEFLFTR